MCGKELTPRVWVVQNLHIPKKGLVLAWPWEVTFKLLDILPGRSIFVYVVSLYKQCHLRGGLEPTWPLKQMETEGLPCGWSARPTWPNSSKNPRYQAQVGFSDWQSSVHVFTHCGWERLALSVQVHWARASRSLCQVSPGPCPVPFSFADFYLHLFAIINHNYELNWFAEFCESFSKSWNLRVILGTFSSNAIIQLTAINILITNCGLKSKENFFLQQIAAHQDHIKCSECVYVCTQQTLSNS